jgi:RNA polymerase sigma-70 factor, ECF subfamily
MCLPLACCMQPPSTDPMPDGEARVSPIDGTWLERFHGGERDVLEACYRDHFAAVWQAVGRVLDGMDRETVVHEVFFRLVADREHRCNFRGGSFSSWVCTVARNLALDYHRRLSRERPLDEAPEGVVIPMSEEALDLAHFVDDFQRKHLPAKWRPVFEARFLRQLSQREAARVLGMHRTTLVYQELRVRRLLRRALLQTRREP